MGLPGSVDGQESPGAASTLLSTAEPSSGLADASQSKRQAASAESASQEMRRVADSLRCSNAPMGAVMLCVLFVCFAGNQ